jgi:hypothetical protein
VEHAELRKEGGGHGLVEGEERSLSVAEERSQRRGRGGGEIKTVWATSDMWSHCHIIQNLHQYQ